MKTNYYGGFFLIGTNSFRWDTRVYLNSGVYEQNQGTCVGAVVAKNPGSAATGTLPWGPMVIGKDKMLPIVLSVFTQAYLHKHYQGNQPPKDAYVQILNLFYLRDHQLQPAKSAIKNYGNPPICGSESNTYPVVWFAWGGDDRSINHFKWRFDKISSKHRFYCDNKVPRIVESVPSIYDDARHPQGLTHAYLVPYLASILR